MQPVLIYPDKRLRLKSQPITAFDRALEQTVHSLYETMYEAHGCGLAAPQVGMDVRLFVMDVSRAGDQPRCFVNPNIVHREDEQFEQEGCISLPGLYASVKRAKTIVLRFYDEKGTYHEESFSDLAAACCQHEIEHLEGILFIDHLSNLKRNWLLRKLKKKVNS